jgi:hypothetical protein
MVPAFLVSERVVREDGRSAEIALESDPDSNKGQPLLLTLGITRTLESESLEVSIWGSCDRLAWRPVGAFPPKCYCGTYHLLLNLSRQDDVRFLRAQWKMSRWDHQDQKPVFDFYVLAEPARMRVAGAA